MNTKIEDGGPAYPTTATATRVTKDEDGASVLTNYGSSAGMTLRDWLAAHASEEDIQEFLPQTIGEEAEFTKKRGFTPTRQWARYKHADAMLAARKEKP
jgi:hypothetical protein